MSQEQEDQSRNNCINGRSITRRPRQRKVPQRGLGVAQLEKILEEQHMKDGVVISPSQNSTSSSQNSISAYLPPPIKNYNHSKDGTIILPSPNSASSSTSPSSISNFLPLPITNFNLMNQNSSTKPLPLPSLDEFRSSISMQHFNGKAPSTVPLPNSGMFGNVPKLWNSHELDFEKENFGVQHGLPFLPSFPFESNQIWPMPNWVQRPPQFHHQHSSQVVSNSISGTSSTHVPQLSIEPPSNQNCSSNGMPMRPGEKMMIGMKRPYPFSMDFPQAPALNYRMPHSGEISTNARTSYDRGSGFHFDAGSSTSRESQSCSASNSDPNSKRRDKGIKDFDASFLTLAPPTPTSCQPSKPLALNNQESPEGNIEDQFHAPPGYRFHQQRQHMYNFIPPAETQNGQTSRTQNGHEMGDTLDLNLKL
ncbi:DNA N6-methyl adenine demethylase isoform X2 [Medicago truncatula]|uniref:SPOROCYTELESS-like EAR-containing protein n=2 Tax=Medicago truncatula TaxID=3880 RepID=A0A072V9Z6_MEDTR|nr:DNA N6-methyl adenine demethylase-like isoform X2 [Medicago truncatula]KEH38642.1 hypothetical protein MTR_2g078220 [Medicago truncatula]QBM11794.1 SPOROCYTELESS-like EAR-containing protein [Medicago truncatula]